MGAFETSKGKAVLPEDLPNPSEAHKQAPDGAIYRSDNGNRYRLRHARWVPVVERKKKEGASAAKK